MYKMNLGGVIHLNKTGICIVCAILLILFLYATSGRTSSEKWNGSNRNENQIELKSLLKVAIQAAENGGFQVVDTKDSFVVKSKGRTKEGLQDSVTTADYLSHCAMMETLKNAFPTIKIISEETKMNCEKIKDHNNNNRLVSLDEETYLNEISEEWVSANDVTVWIDPLDATHEYTEKLFEYVTTMVCVAVKGKAVIGVVHKPFLKIDQARTAWAYKTYRHNLEMNDTAAINNGKAKIIISRSHSGDIRKVLGTNLAKYELVIAAGAGYKGLEVARGNVDAYLHITAIKKWDICAVNALINSLGGQMTTKFNEVIDYTDLTNYQNENGLVATLKNHQKYIDMLKNG